MSENISIELLSSAIEKEMQLFEEDVIDGIDNILSEVSQETCEAIRADSPKKKGEYAAGWSVKKEGDKKKPGYIIHNATKPQLTSLLEKGHAKTGGGRVQAYPHIRKNEQKAIKEVTQRINTMLEGL